MCVPKIICCITHCSKDANYLVLLKDDFFPMVPSTSAESFIFFPGALSKSKIKSELTELTPKSQLDLLCCIEVITWPLYHAQKAPLVLTMACAVDGKGTRHSPTVHGAQQQATGSAEAARRAAVAIDIIAP